MNKFTENDFEELEKHLTKSRPTTDEQEILVQEMVDKGWIYMILTSQASGFAWFEKKPEVRVMSSTGGIWEAKGDEFVEKSTSCTKEETAELNGIAKLYRKFLGKSIQGPW